MRALSLAQNRNIFTQTFAVGPCVEMRVPLCTETCIICKPPTAGRRQAAAERSRSRLKGALLAIIGVVRWWFVKYAHAITKQFLAAAAKTQTQAKAPKPLGVAVVWGSTLTGLDSATCKTHMTFIRDAATQALWHKGYGDAQTVGFDDSKSSRHRMDQEKHLSSGVRCTASSRRRCVYFDFVGG